MAWRNPRFAYRHAVRDAGVSALSLEDGAEDPSRPLERLLDGRRSTNFACTPVYGAAYVMLDRGAAARTDVNRIYIPVGHNSRAWA